MSLFSRPPSYIGLDIGTSSMKLVELQRDGKSGVRLATYALAQGIPAHPLAGQHRSDTVANTAMTIRDMLKKAGTASDNIIAALPNLSVFSSVISLPLMQEKELEQAVLHAAQSYVPSPLNDVMIGWSVIKEKAAPMPSTPLPTPPVPVPAVSPLSVETFSPVQKTPMQEIFLTAAPKDLVQRYSSVIERVGLHLLALEVESFALVRSLLKGEPRPVLLVDIGDHTTNLSVVDNGYLRLNQSIDVAGASITNILQQTLGIPREEAEQRKRSIVVSDGAGADPAAAAVLPVLRGMVEKSQNVRRLYEQKSQRLITKAVLIGGGAHLKGLSALWTTLAGIPVEVGNPWKGIRVPVQLTAKLEELGPSFSVAVGLALREFDESP